MNLNGASSSGVMGEPGLAPQLSPPGLNAEASPVEPASLLIRQVWRGLRTLLDYAGRKIRRWLEPVR